MNNVNIWGFIISLRKENYYDGRGYLIKDVDYPPQSSHRGVFDMNIKCLNLEEGDTEYYIQINFQSPVDTNAVKYRMYHGRVSIYDNEVVLYDKISNTDIRVDSIREVLNLNIGDTK